MRPRGEGRSPPRRREGRGAHRGRVGLHSGVRRRADGTSSPCAPRRPEGECRVSAGASGEGGRAGRSGIRHRRITPGPAGAPDPAPPRSPPTRGPSRPPTTRAGDEAHQRLRPRPACPRVPGPKPGDGFITVDAIAGAEGLSETFLRKALTALAKARVLLVNRGRHGGFRLARPARSITLLEVLEAVEGPVRGEAPGAAGR